MIDNDRNMPEVQILRAARLWAMTRQRRLEAQRHEQALKTSQIPGHEYVAWEDVDIARRQEAKAKRLLLRLLDQDLARSKLDVIEG